MRIRLPLSGRKISATVPVLDVSDDAWLSTSRTSAPSIGSPVSESYTPSNRARYGGTETIVPGAGGGGGGDACAASTELAKRHAGSPMLLATRVTRHSNGLRTKRIF